MLRVDLPALAAPCAVHSVGRAVHATRSALIHEVNDKIDLDQNTSALALFELAICKIKPAMRVSHIAIAPVDD